MDAVPKGYAKTPFKGRQWPAKINISPWPAALLAIDYPFLRGKGFTLSAFKFKILWRSTFMAYPSHLLGLLEPFFAHISLPLYRFSFRKLHYCPVIIALINFHNGAMALGLGLRSPAAFIYLGYM